MKDLMIILLRKMESGSTIVKMLKEFENTLSNFDLIYFTMTLIRLNTKKMIKVNWNVGGEACR